jgi:hypothetical protein
VTLSKCITASINLCANRHPGNGSSSLQYSCQNYLNELNESSFAVTSLSSRANILIDYTDVHKVKGYNLSKGAKIGIGLGVAADVAIII